MGALTPDPQGAAHIAVLLAEVLEGLQVRPGGLYIDGTLGGGGHTEMILARSSLDGVGTQRSMVLGLDADPAAIRRVEERLSGFVAEQRLILVQTPFERMAEVARERGFGAVDGILLDLGLSSFQLGTAERGFAFALEGPLDMRFDPTAGESAADLLNRRSAEEIADILYRYGEEHRSRRIAGVIVQNRPIRTTSQLAALVEKALGGRRGARIHPATQTFQALRIAVNDELGQLERVLPQTLDLLKPSGRLAIISFHSLEDRIVKTWMRDEAQRYQPDPTHPLGGVEREPRIALVTKKPIVPGPEEISQNPRSRSAKLRIAERL
ncbi:MAG: 16S rRNA (cytosine(1402)-N(4))-methyltransferase RsmH [Caldilineaceae bacterium]|nr:16S rRNA (cytosine(1402)-N(4))-methyltransferase RsmH [Caldilineaceae bacterium]